MADLPRDRISPVPPFTYMGVDYFGPFIIKDGRKEVKRYGALFTCLVSRAVHIEVRELYSILVAILSSPSHKMIPVKHIYKSLLLFYRSAVRVVNFLVDVREEGRGGLALTSLFQFPTISC